MKAMGVSIELALVHMNVDVDNALI